MVRSLTDPARRRGGRPRGLAALAVAATVTLAACACQRATDAGEPSAAAEEVAAAEPVEADPVEADPVPGGVNPAGVPPELLTSALEDAATRTRAAVADIEVVVAEPVTWADGSIGCPQPGVMYTQALVPGYRIVLRAFGESLNYHAGSSGGPRYCPSGQVSPPAPGGAAQIR